MPLALLFDLPAAFSASKGDPSLLLFNDHHLPTAPSLPAHHIPKCHFSHPRRLDFNNLFSAKFSHLLEQGLKVHCALLDCALSACDLIKISEF